MRYDFASGMKTYHQYCPVAHALDLIGERWSLLIARELMLGPKRYTDLAEALPGCGTNILAARMKALEANGIVRKTKLPPPAAVSVYELTDYGRELESVLMSLARWGARSIGAPRAGDCWSMYAVHTNFRPEAAAGIDETYEIRFDDESTVTLIVRDGTLDARQEPADDPDLVLAIEPATLVRLLERELTVSEVVADGRARIVDGDESAFERLVSLFAFADAPVAA